MAYLNLERLRRRRGERELEALQQEGQHAGALKD
jgi:hypothetical protein